jgi:hypothetical protein
LDSLSIACEYFLSSSIFPSLLALSSFLSASSFIFLLLSNSSLFALVVCRQRRRSV